MLNDIYQALDPVAFSIGPLEVRWYGLAYVVAFVCAGVFIARLSKRWKLNITPDDVLSLILALAFGVIIGARVGYCIFYGDGYYLQHPIEILAINQGGMSFHGGLIGGIIGATIAALVMKIPVFTVFDLAVIFAPIGLFCGRCANFINGELWGKVTDLPWGVVFADTGGGMLPRHPSQLYEALLEGVVLFIIMFLLSRKSNPPRVQGTFVSVFMICYGLFRTAVEFVRLPDEQLGYLFGTDWITMGMCLSLPVTLVGIVFLIISLKRRAPQRGRLKK